MRIIRNLILAILVLNSLQLANSLIAMKIINTDESVIEQPMVSEYFTDDNVEDEQDNVKDIESKIIHHDSPPLTYVDNTIETPYSTVVLLKNNIGTWCSGVLIDVNLVLTAAHCVYKNGIYRKIAVYPGRTTIDDASYSPFGGSRVIKIYISDFIKEAYYSIYEDYAVLLLEDNIGEDSGYMSMISIKDPSLDISKLHVSSYPTGYQKTATHKFKMMTSNGGATFLDNKGLHHKMATKEGSSGAGVYFLKEQDGEMKPFVTGVHAGAAYNGWNYAVPLTDERIAIIQNWHSNLVEVRLVDNEEIFRKNVIKNELFGDLYQPEKEGYDFVGWFIENEEEVIGFDSVVPNNSNSITLHAKWSAKQQTVIWDYMGGTGTGTDTKYTDTRWRTGDRITLTDVLVEPTKEGSTFIGWDNLPYSVVNGTNSIAAKWNINKYTLTFDSVGGEEVNSQTREYSELFTEPSNPTKDGYTFLGWYRDAEYTEIYDFSTAATEDLTVFVRWEKIPVYSIASRAENITVEASIGPVPTDWTTVFGVGAIDIFDKNITESIEYTIDSELTAMNIPGTYKIIASVKDNVGNKAAEKELTYIIVDTTAPAITMTKQEVRVEATGGEVPTYWTTIFSVEATDIVDGNQTGSIEYTIDSELTAMNIPGTYKIIASVKDIAGNKAAEKELTYIIEDTTAPAITVVKEEVRVEATGGEVPTDWTTIFSVEATDIVDGNQTGSIEYTIDSELTAMNIPGRYEIVANVKDKAGNKAIKKELTYIIEDTTAPEISVTKEEVTVEATGGEVPTDWTTIFGVGVTDIVDKNLTGSIEYTIDSELTAMNIPGTYKIIASVKDIAGNRAAEKELTYIIEDTTAPSITVTKQEVRVEATGGEVPTDWTTVFGVEATDIVDGNLTGSIEYTIDSELTAMNIPGTYKIIASVKDSVGNKAAEKELTYIIEDTIKSNLSTSSEENETNLVVTGANILTTLIFLGLLLLVSLFNLICCSIKLNR